MPVQTQETPKKEVDGYDALVFSADASDEDNERYRQLIIAAEHAVSHLLRTASNGMPLA